MTRLNRQVIAFCVAISAFWSTQAAAAARAIIVQEDRAAPFTFASNEIESALRARKYQVNRTEEWRLDAEVHAEVVVRFALVDRSDDPQFEKLAREGFLLRNVALENHRELMVLSLDSAGGMYGGLELAEQIRILGVDGVADTDRNPYMPLRGTKFNIPLDLRTPSYSDMSDSAQANIDTVWDFDFWRAYLDQLARDRYNMVSLWNLHPFPSMVKVPEYPDVALADARRSSSMKTIRPAPPTSSRRPCWPTRKSSGY